MGTIAIRTLDGDVQEHDLIFSWPDGRHLNARLHHELVWKPALAAVGVIPPPYKDNRGRRRFKTDRTTGLHALRHYFASITLADGSTSRSFPSTSGITIQDSRCRCTRICCRRPTTARGRQWIVGWSDLLGG
ncbi:hypothetical protein [Kribbella sp. VKM Ac-2566]|uniref:hypothetical protein n=1 Tax=Kribbella sp. VKM Ac-2566 TaxID=2512218 RepID=UPI001EDE0CBD|nr:hypothetical protein [Kribbella sp. VKM Ac-2566]